MHSVGVGAGASPPLWEADAGAQGWTAIVLAGSRDEEDPLAAHFGLPLKALVPVAGTPMIAHVVSTLVQCPSIARVLIVSQRPILPDCPGLQSLSERCPIHWAAGKDGIAESLAVLVGTEVAPWPLLVTTADHPLLTQDMVEHFLERSGASDVSLAVVDRCLLSARYPRSRRTWLRFRAGAYTGANLFAVRTPASAQALTVLARAEASRKAQLRLLWHFGPALALGALTRTMSLQQVVERAGMRLGLKPAVVSLPFAEAGIDVDSMEDWRFADQLLSNGSEASPDERTLPVTVFDLDRTLTRRGTYTAFLLHAAWRRAPWRLLLAPLAIFGFLAYLCGAWSRKSLKERLQALFLGGKVPRGEIAQLAEGFVGRLRFHADALRTVEAERRAGRRIVLATAANAFYVDAIASALGIDEVVCTQSSWDGDYLTPRIAGENCHGSEKLAMLQAHFRNAGLASQSLHVRFFSDHPSDQPVFCWADEAYVVNPPRGFRSYAAAAGWPVLTWT
jgi:HAD superfamily phosphoserine phosphatase-like hydrolase